MQKLIKVIIILLVVILVLSVSLGILFYKDIINFQGKNGNLTNNGNMQEFSEKLLFAKEFVKKKIGSLFFSLDNTLIDEEKEGGKYRKIEFSYENPKAQKVYICGEFNDWANEPMEKNGRIWTKTKYLLPDCEYVYQLIVDGTNISDPINPNNIDLGIKGVGSYIATIVTDLHTFTIQPKTYTSVTAFENQTDTENKFFISGKVCDRGKKPIAGAIVKIFKDGLQIKQINTIEDGSFTAEKIAKGKYEIKTWKEKFKAQKLSVEITSSDLKKINFFLERNK